MKRCTISTKNIEDIDAFCRALNFVSEQIIEITHSECHIEVCYEETEEDLYDSLVSYAKAFSTTSDHSINDVEWKTSRDKDIFFSQNSIRHSGILRDNGNGFVILTEAGLALYEAIDAKLRNIALEFHAIEKKYPVLLDVSTLIKSGYVRMSPQYTTLCCCPTESIETLSRFGSALAKGTGLSLCNSPHHALSPSACFHVYAEHENSTLKEDSIITFRQCVFRNEGRLNWSDFGRLRDYTVREIVMLGSRDYVSTTRTELVNSLKNLCLDLEIGTRLIPACDPFVMPELHRFKKIQISESLKYELQVECAPNRYLSVASFNLHGTAFGSAFNINEYNRNPIESGCIGVGLERFAMAYLSQFGTNPKKWSIKI
jgi:seryl-tRNA synthetase